MADTPQPAQSGGKFWSSFAAFTAVGVGGALDGLSISSTLAGDASKGNDDSHETTALPASTPADGSTADSPLEENDNQPIADHQDDTHLIIRICQAIEENKLFLNPNLKVTVIASILGSNRTTVSNCINNQRGCSFPQLVNAYRVAYAQNLMRNQPDIKIADVWMAAGFSSEASFYRIFKTVAGITPKEWKSDQVSSPPTPQ